MADLKDNILEMQFITNKKSVIISQVFDYLIDTDEHTKLTDF
jgi:hypothetical protein